MALGGGFVKISADDVPLNILIWLAIISSTLFLFVIEPNGDNKLQPSDIDEIGHDQSIVQIMEEMGFSNSLFVESQFVGSDEEHIVSKFHNIFWPDAVGVGVRSSGGSIY